MKKLLTSLAILALIIFLFSVLAFSNGLNLPGFADVFLAFVSISLAHTFIASATILVCVFFVLMPYLIDFVEDNYE